MFWTTVLLARLPHVRGGEPEAAADESHPTHSSLPHVRGGEPPLCSGPLFCSPVFPTCVGVNRKQRPTSLTRHIPVFPTCVGVNLRYVLDHCSARPSSPRAWG